MPNYGIVAPVQSSGFPHKTAFQVYSSGISGYQSLDWDRLMGKFDDIIENTNEIEISVSGNNFYVSGVYVNTITGDRLLQSGVALLQDQSGKWVFHDSGVRDTNRLTIDLFDTSQRISGLSGKLGEVTGLLLTNNINLFDTSQRISGLSGKLGEVTGLLLTNNINLFDVSQRISGLSGKFGEVTGLLLTNNINAFDITQRISGLSGKLGEVTGLLLTNNINTSDLTLRVSGLSGKLGEVTGLLLTNNINLSDASLRISGLSGKLGEVTGLLLTNNINLFDVTSRLSGISGSLLQTTGKLSNIYEYLQTGVQITQRASGSSIIVTAVSTTGTFRLVSYLARKTVFINQRDPQYRVYKNNETGLDYLRWIPCGSGGWANRAEVEGISNLNELAIQTDNTVTTALSGVCIAYF